MTNNWSRNQYQNPIIGFGYVSRTRTAYALDTAFTLGSAGKCLGIRFVCPVTDTIDDILFFVSSAPASAHDLSVNVCSLSAYNKPGSALANGSITVSGGTSNDKWIKATFSSKPSLTAGTVYYIVIGDPAGAAANYSILSQGFSPQSNTTYNYLQYGYTSSDGFATAGSSSCWTVAFCIHFTNGTYYGQPYTLAPVSDASAAVERGWKVTFDEDVTICGISCAAMPSSGTVKIYQDGQSPGGTIFSGFNGGSAFTLYASSISITGVLFPPCTLIGGITYRIVIDPGSATTAPGYGGMEDAVTESTILQACGFPGCAQMLHTEESGGAWVDSSTKIPRMALLLQNNPAQDLPDVGNVTEDDTVGGAQGTYHEATTSEVQSGVHFGAGSGLTGTYAPSADYPAESDVRDGVDYDNAAKTGTCHVPAAADVESGVAVDATTGTFVVPAVGDVEDGVQYGAGGTEFEGTLIVGGGSGRPEIRGANL